MVALNEEQRQLVSDHYYLVRAVVNRCPLSDDVDKDALISDCSVGLMKAAARYKASSGVQFQTFAWVWVAGALKMNLREHARRRKHGVLMDNDTIPVTNDSDVEKVSILNEVQTYLAVLDENELKVIDLVFFKGYNVTEIGEMCHLSRFRVNEVYLSAIRKMQAAAGLCDDEMPLFQWADQERKENNGCS